MARKLLYTLEEFGHDVRNIVESEGEGVDAVLRMGQYLQRLTTENDHEAFWDYGVPAKISSGLPGQRLYDDPDQKFRVLLAEYPPNMPTAVHSHEGWVVVGLLKGSERYTSWRRTDDGSDPTKATLEVAQDHHILPGEFGYLFNEPYNVHRQAAESQGALEIVLMAGRGQRLVHIDEETGDCSQPMELGR
ncbi:MAG: hypothetical protein V3S98_00715 [Dehalococcoidia bacterium]